MYRIVYNEEGCKKSVWCYGRNCAITICQSLYLSPYIYSIAIYDVDDNLVQVWGVVD